VCKSLRSVFLCKNEIYGRSVGLHCIEMSIVRGNLCELHIGHAQVGGLLLHLLVAL
jgi:hypothetical protein